MRWPNGSRTGACCGWSGCSWKPWFRTGTGWCGLALTPILAAYETGDGRGQPPYHPALMVKLLVYAYCTGKPSSRKIEQATYDEVPYRVLAANQHPDHDTLAAFRQTHLAALAGLFTQVLALCQQAGLVKLGHVALDETKVLANASKHKAMRDGRMGEAEQQLEREVAARLARAAQVDAAEDARYGKGQRGDALPAEVARRESRRTKIREARAALEAEWLLVCLTHNLLKLFRAGWRPQVV